MLKELTAIHKAGIAIVGCTAIIISAMTYFTPAEAFRQHLELSRKKELISMTSQYELQYKCYREGCMSVMPELLYEKYKEMYLELDELIGKDK